jgi:hypothetical protein
MGLNKNFDDYHRRRGQIDGAHGKLRGDIGNKAYDEGYDAGLFDYEKQRFGEAWARANKAERDFVKGLNRPTGKGDSEDFSSYQGPRASRWTQDDRDASRERREEEKRQAAKRLQNSLLVQEYRNRIKKLKGVKSWGWHAGNEGRWIEAEIKWYRQEIKRLEGTSDWLAIIGLSLLIFGFLVGLSLLFLANTTSEKHSSSLDGILGDIRAPTESEFKEKASRNEAYQNACRKDPNACWLATSNSVSHSSDGLTWDNLLSLDNSPIPAPIDMVSIYSKSHIMVWLEKEGAEKKVKLIETMDGGKIWEYIICYKGQCEVKLRTFDKGKTWEAPIKETVPPAPEGPLEENSLTLE